MKNIAYLCNAFRKQRELSSAGSERLPYKQRVGGSNPSAPTEKRDDFKIVSFFFVYATLSRAAKIRIIRRLNIFHKTGKPRRNAALSSATCSFGAPTAFNELSAEVCGPQPRPLQTREKRNICGSKNVRLDAPRDGQQPRSQTPSRHSSLETAYLAPRQGIDIIPQFVAVGSAAITIIGRQYMPLTKGTKIILAARLQKQSALRAFIVLAPHGIARRAADIAAVKQVQFSSLKECSRNMRKQDE